MEKSKRRILFSRMMGCLGIGVWLLIAYKLVTGHQHLGPIDVIGDTMILVIAPFSIWESFQASAKS